MGVQDVREEEVGEIRGPGRRGDRGGIPGRPGGGDPGGGWDFEVCKEVSIKIISFVSDRFQTSSPRDLGVTILGRGRASGGW